MVQVPEPTTDGPEPGVVHKDEVEDDLEDLQAGVELLHTQTQGQAQGLADYLASLEAWRGVCMICYHLPRAVSGQESHARHSLRTCPNPRRFKYFDAKKEAQAQGQRRGGWFPRFNSCYRCFNPQVVCDQQGQGQCLFTDLVIPASWAVFQKPAWVAQYLGRLGGPHVAEDEAAYMLWLGEQQTVFGEVASNATAVTRLVLQQMQ